MKYVVVVLSASFVVLVAVAGVLLLAPDAGADCDAIEDRGDRRTCFAERERAAELATLRAEVDKGDSAWERDLIRLRYVTNDPALSYYLCPDIEGDEARELCLNVQGRSHLWRDGGEKKTRGRGRRE